MKKEQNWPMNGRTPASLVWQDDNLIDWAGGGDGWEPDGTPTTRSRYYSEIFDAAVASASGRYQIIYTEFGTKAVLLEDGENVRELNRSYYQSDVYGYPLATTTLADGREVLIHCPDEYNVLQVETLDTGERLTAREGESLDIFHARLSVSPGGRWLLSAGWVWHPFGVAEVYDLTQALADPAVLDARSPLSPSDEPGEIESACWLDDDRLAVLSIIEDSGNWPQLSGGSLGVWSMKAAGWESKVPYREHLGTMVAFGDHLLSLYEYPKLLDPATGAVVEAWPHLPTGNRMLAYGLTHEPQPAVAVHPDGTRFAVASDEHITVVEWS